MKLRSSLLALASLAVAGFLNASVAQATPVCGPDGTPCNDFNACTIGETCLGGSCVGGTPVVCQALDGCHLPGVCNTVTGECPNPNAPDGTACDDLDPCPGDTCQAGVCEPAICSSTTTIPFNASTTTTLPATGACCLAPHGGCVEVDLNSCQGVYQGGYSGDGTTCASGICTPPPTTTTLPPPPTTTTLPPPPTTTTLPPVTGACCFGLGGCEDVTANFCEVGYQGDGTTCASGICAPPPTTTTLPPPPTTTTLPPPPTGACCAGSNCFDGIEASVCAQQYLGGYAGDGTSCKSAGVCVNCGDGCLQFGEQCDDGDTGTGDGCDASCQEEPCFSCQTVQPTGLNLCSGPSTCQPAAGPTCSHCGNAEVEVGEDCDDGNTANGDCCTANCKFDVVGTSCSDGNFCNGDETCNGEGTCRFDEVGRDCSNLTSQCGTGYCDTGLNACAVETASKDGDSCSQNADCTIPGSGTCQDGSCVGAGTTLSASCRWIILGATPGGTVKVRTGEFSTVDANTCGDTGRSGGITSGDFVVTSDTGEGIRFDASAKIDGDIVTGGSSMVVNLYAKVPGTELEGLGAGMTATKTPAGVADTTGAHPLVAVCNDDQASLHDAANALNAKLQTQDKGLYRVKPNVSDTIDISSTPGLSVLDFATFRLGHNSTLTLKGNPNDVLMLRVNTGRLNISTGAHIVLDGLKPENVLFYVKAPTCRLSTRVVGAGTLFCPMAGKFRIGVGTKWSGSFLGGTREIRARFRAELTHVPFTGF